jgi:OmcA/MtrC family decaheme c-type cytochrome
VTFRLTDGAGAALTSLEGLNAVRFNASGPNTDFGATTPPLVSGTAQASSGETGTLTGPDGEGVFTYVFGTVPAGATGTWRVGIEARGASVTAPNGESVSPAAQNQLLDFSVDGSPVVPRRTVASDEKCAVCHGTFSVDFSIHGNLRNKVDYCAICHHPRATDFSSRSSQIANGADPDSESIHLKVLTHKLHTGEALDQTLYIVYGRQGRPIDLGEVRFPGDRRDCATCHENGSHLLPLPAGLLPTRLSRNDAGTEVTVEDRPPVTAACLTCHGSEGARAHAEANTFSGTEACQVCHGEGRVAAVSEVHARAE